MEEQEKCECFRYKERTADEQKELIRRLNRVEGQIRGIKAMVEEDRYCVDIITQVQAAQSALNGFSRELLVRHMRTCVKEDILAGREDSMDEVCDLIRKMIRA